MGKCSQKFVLQAICFLSIRAGVALTFKQSGELLFSAPALSKLADLSPDPSCQIHQLVVRLSDLRTQKLEYSPDVVAYPYRETERATQALPQSNRSTREVWILN